MYWLGVLYHCHRVLTQLQLTNISIYINFASFDEQIPLYYCNTFTVHLLLFCAMTNKCTIISQNITLLHVSTLSCHLQGVCDQCLAKLHKYFKCKISNSKPTPPHKYFYQSLLSQTNINTSSCCHQFYSFYHLAQLNNHPLLLFLMRLRNGASHFLSSNTSFMQLPQVFQIQNIKFKNQQLHLKYLCDLARHWSHAPWRWHDSVVTCRSVIFCVLIIHLLATAQNKKRSHFIALETNWYFECLKLLSIDLWRKPRGFYKIH